MGKQEKKIKESIQQDNDTLKEAINDMNLSKKDKAYLHGTPSRAEVANYVTSIIEQHYIPGLQAGFRLGLMVLQAILIKKGICTGEEVQEFTKKFVEEAVAKEKQQSQQGQATDKPQEPVKTE